MSSFKDKYSFIKRSTESERIKSLYPDRIPVICEKDTYSSIKNIDKTKFLIPHNLTVGQFMFILRNRIKLNPDVKIILS